MDPVRRDLKDPFNEGPVAAKARRQRSVAIALAVVGFILLVFVITLVRLSSNVAP